MKTPRVGSAGASVPPKVDTTTQGQPKAADQKPSDQFERQSHAANQSARQLPDLQQLTKADPDVAARGLKQWQEHLERDLQLLKDTVASQKRELVALTQAGTYLAALKKRLKELQKQRQKLLALKQRITAHQRKLAATMMLGGQLGPSALHEKLKRLRRELSKLKAQWAKSFRILEIAGSLDQRHQADDDEAMEQLGDIGMTDVRIGFGTEAIANNLESISAKRALAHFVAVHLTGEDLDIAEQPGNKVPLDGEASHWADFSHEISTQGED